MEPVAATAQRSCAALGPRINRALKRTDTSVYDPELVIAAQAEFARLIGQLDRQVSKAAKTSGLANIEPPSDPADPLYSPQRAVSRLSKFARLVRRQAPLIATELRDSTSEAGVAAAQRAQALYQQAQQQDWTTPMATIAPACGPDKVRVFGGSPGY